MTMIETDKEHFKQINIYLVDGSRYVIKPLDDGLAKYVNNIISIEFLECKE